jgi:hypothetical protein
MILCMHNIPRKDCKDCMRLYNRERERRRRHGAAADKHEHEVPVYRELALRAWRSAVNGEA